MLQELMQCMLELKPRNIKIKYLGNLVGAPKGKYKAPPS